MRKKMDEITIGKLSELTGLSRETLRFYEQKKLIPNPKRNKSGYRLYQQDTVRRIRFIQYTKKMGFSLKEIRTLLSLRINPEGTCSEIKQYTDSKITEITNQITALVTMRDTLTQLSSSCSGRGPISSCPILDAFENTLAT
jgi:MerR family mercuric resistance operon transcriptional regulator